MNWGRMAERERRERGGSPERGVAAHADAEPVQLYGTSQSQSVTQRGTCLCRLTGEFASDKRLEHGAREARNVRWRVHLYV